jgi:threonine dehydratase
VRVVSPCVVHGYSGGVPELVTVDDVRQAAHRLDGVVVRTPLLHPAGLPAGLLLKPECLQPTGAFKLRGAYNAISALPPVDRVRGVVAHSSGNHGFAVAYAAALLEVPATIVVPENASKVKTAAIAATGATLVTVPPTLSARIQATTELASRSGYSVIAPFDDRNVIAGQGTIGLEIAADCPDVRTVVVPVSGGGLISGIAVAIRELCPQAQVIGVEPELAADAQESLRSGRRVRWTAEQTGRTLADGLRVEQVGEITFPHIRELVTDIITVTEEELVAAMRTLATRARLIAEPSGAVATAACLYHDAELPEGTRVAIVSGGNVDPGLLATVLT